jgi:hypothetical protein
MAVEKKCTTVVRTLPNSRALARVNLKRETTFAVLKAKGVKNV